MPDKFLMKIIIISISLIISLSALAQKADLLLIDENIDASTLEENFNIKKGSTLKSYLPPKEARDDFLKNIPESQSWDEYQKDAFYMDIKKKTSDEIIKKYPYLSKAKVAALKAKI